MINSLAWIKWWYIKQAWFEGKKKEKKIHVFIKKLMH